MSPSALYQWPTIRRLAVAVDEAPCHEAASVLIPIRHKDSPSVVVLVPNILGDPLMYAGLVKHLARERDIYGLRISGRDLEKTLDEAAAYYVDEIRSVLPSRTYSLVGYSSGGLMALEMARKFREVRLEAPFLAMIDTISPFSRQGRHPQQEPTYYPSRLRNVLSWLKYSSPFWTSHYLRKAVNKSYRLCSKEARNNVLKVRDWLEAYEPKNYSGRIIFYKAEAQGLFASNPDRWLQSVCDSIDVRVVRGNHVTMLKEPRVGLLAERINSDLRNADLGAGAFN